MVSSLHSRCLSTRWEAISRVISYKRFCCCFCSSCCTHQIQANSYSHTTQSFCNAGVTDRNYVYINLALKCREKRWSDANLHLPTREWQKQGGWSWRNWINFTSEVQKSGIQECRKCLPTPFPAQPLHRLLIQRFPTAAAPHFAHSPATLSPALLPAPRTAPAAPSPTPAPRRRRKSPVSLQIWGGQYERPELCVYVKRRTTEE